MKIVFNLFLLCLLLAFTQCDSQQSKSLDEEQFNLLEDALIEKNYFWQDGEQAVLFEENGKIKFLRLSSDLRDNSSTKTAGKWYIDKDKNTIVTAFEYAPQQEWIILDISKEVDEIRLKYYDIDDDSWRYWNLKKMKLLDDRFKGKF